MSTLNHWPLLSCSPSTIGRRNGLVNLSKQRDPDYSLRVTFGELLLSIPVTLGSLGLKVIVLQGEHFHRKFSKSWISFKLYCHLDTLNSHAKKQWGWKKNYHLARVIDSGHSEEIKLVISNSSRSNMFGISGIHLGISYYSVVQFWWQMDKCSHLDLSCHAKQELRPLKNEDLHELTRKPHIKYQFVLKTSFTGKTCSSTPYPSELLKERDSLEFWDRYS